MVRLPSSQRARQLAPVWYRIVLGLSVLIGVLALAGFVGNLFYIDWLGNWGILDSATMMKSTAVALICFSIIIPMALSPQRKKPKSVVLQGFLYFGSLYPLIMGLYFTSFHLTTQRFNLFKLFTQTDPRHFPSFLSALCVLLIAIAVVTLLRWRNVETAVVYGAGVPAILVFSITVFAMTGYWQGFPTLYNFMLPFSTAVVLALVSIALLIGTIPYDGLLIPLISHHPKVIIMGYASLLGGIILTLKGLVDIDAINHFAQWNVTLLKHYLVSSALSTLCLSTLFIVISLRALHNYEDADYHTLLQKKYTSSEALLRRIVEIIHGDLNLEENLQKITNILGGFLDCDYCLMMRIDPKTAQIMMPVQEYHSAFLSSNGILSTPEKREMLQQFINQVCQKKRLVELDAEASDLPPLYLKFLQQARFRTVIAVPIKYRGENFGAILLGKISQAKTWNKTDQWIVKSTAEQVAIAVHQSELFNLLKTRETNFQKILEANIIGVFFWKMDGSITYANQAFLDMIGYTKEELTAGHLSWWMLSPPDREELDFQRIRELSEKGAVSPAEAQYQAKNGQIVDVIRGSTMLQDTDEEGVSFIVNITKLKQVEQALLDKNRELEQFASIASHDLQAPLRKIKAFVDLLLQDAAERLNESDCEYLDRIQGSISRMQQLIGDLLLLARVNRNQKPFEWVDLQELCREVLHDLSYEISKKRAHVEVGNLMSIEADPTQMYQLFQNLIGNSLKYQKDDEAPKIQIQMRKTAANRCLLEIKDNGFGFPQDKADWIFGAFTRLVSMEERKGSGIGLAICRKIVDRHNGKIWAVSSLGQGAQFFVELPIRQPVPQPDPFSAVTQP